MKKEKIEILQKAQEITTNEVQLLQWPYFCVSTAQPSDTQVEYTELLNLNGSELRRRWVVRCHDNFGWPGQLEADVWRSVEHIMHKQRESGMLSNPVVTTLGQIRRYMPSKWRGGSNLKLIVKAIKCLAHTIVECDFFYDAQEKVSRNASFSLIHEWRFDHKRKENGKDVLEKTKLLIHPDVFNNIAAIHVRPLDRGFRDELRSWLAKRLYEVLGVKFYALRKKKVPYCTRYSRLCALLGCKRQHYLCHAKLIIGRAHKELQEQKFLGKVEWYPCARDTRDWVLHYWPGERAVNEWDNKYFKQVVNFADPIFVESLPETGQDPVWMEQLESDESSVVVDVVSGNNERKRSGNKSNRTTKNAASNRESSKENKKSTSAHKSQPLSKTSNSRPVPDEIESAQIDTNREIHKKTKLSEEAVVAVFEQMTGSSRRMTKLSEAERKLLNSWMDAGVTIDIIVSGISQVLQIEKDRSIRTGEDIRSIWSIDYCAWSVWDVFSKKLRCYEDNSVVKNQKDNVEEHVVPIQEENCAYEHINEWSKVCLHLEDWLAPKNYAQVIQKILASRLEHGTLHLVVSDPYWRDYIFETYQTHLLEASGADALEIEVVRGSV